MLTHGLVHHDLAASPEDSRLSAPSLNDFGGTLYRQYGITGIRGEAEAGFPTVFLHGFPILENCLSSGCSEDEAGATALLHILAHTTDTNMIRRSSLPFFLQKQAELRAFLETHPGCISSGQILPLDQEYIACNLSPGGSADLLALCWFLHFLKEDLDHTAVIG